MTAAAPSLSDLTSIQWRSVDFVSAVGPLNERNVLDYFSQSPFFDRQSTNQQLRMQFIATGLGDRDEAEELKRFTGVEFAVVHARPPNLFVIHKRIRTSPTEARPVAAYYVLNDNIYQAPDLYAVLTARLAQSVHSLRSALDIARSSRPPFSVRTGHQWKIVEPEESTSASTGPVPAITVAKPDETATAEKATQEQENASAPDGKKRKRSDATEEANSEQIPGSKKTK